MDYLSGIDWRQAWYLPWTEVGQPVAQLVAAGLPLPSALNQAAQQRGVHCPRFVPQAALPAGRAYESHVALHGECPTREGLHDFFNGLCWLQFPLTKQRLNVLQFEQIQRHGIQARRGPVRDAVTLLDESAALLSAPEPLWQALCAKDWLRLFVTLRPLWADAHLLLFGHASLERLVAPRKPMVAHVFRSQRLFPFDLTDLSVLDAQLAQDLDAHHLATKPFAPLPLMGVPHWCADNADAVFYQDSLVFRPPAS